MIAVLATAAVSAESLPGPPVSPPRPANSYSSVACAWRVTVSNVAEVTDESDGTRLSGEPDAAPSRVIGVAAGIDGLTYPC